MVLKDVSLLAKTNSSQKVELQNCAANHPCSAIKTGVDSPITKTSRGSRSLFGMPIFLMIRQINEKIKLHLGYKSGFSFSKVAFQIQKLRFVYKYSLVNYKGCFSLYKVASRLSIKVQLTRVFTILANY